MDLVVSGLVVSVLTGFLPILAGSSCPSNFGSSPVLTSEGADFLVFIFYIFFTVKVQPLRKSVFCFESKERTKWSPDQSRLVWLTKGRVRK